MPDTPEKLAAILAKTAELLERKGFPASVAEETNIDEELQRYPCPCCNGREFRTLQRCYAVQDVSDGEWQSARSSTADTTTVKAVCRRCGEVLYHDGEHEDEELPLD